MYYIIEDSPQGLTVVATRLTEVEACNTANDLYNDNCDYYVTVSKPPRR